MSLVSTLQSQHHAFIDSRARVPLHSSFDSLNSSVSSPASGSFTDDQPNPEATLSTLLVAPSPVSLSQSMERGSSEYSQSGLHSPYPSTLSDLSSEDPSVDHASVAQYASQQQEVRSTTYSASATPTSEYGVYPSSARSASFPDHIPRPYHPASTHNGGSGGMAQPTSPSMSLPDGARNHHNPQVKTSDTDVPIDPSIAASSPTYPPHGGQYSPYPPQQDMSHGYQHPAGSMYAQPRPDWTGYGQQHAHHLPPGYPVTGAQTPTTAAPASARPGQVYSFVPIPGAQQHKRPRRRYEEIERMYKCGWNGCEKAYGTLNHLNAHVTMQSHGQKRTPEEFKEIRKEWKQRKKEEENARKAAEEERQRSAASQNGSGGPEGGPEGQPGGYVQAGRPPVQLPPIGYQPGSQVPGQYQAPSGGVQQLQEYGSNHLYSGYPTSPYGQPNQMYSQRH